MVYSPNKVVACVKVDGRILREDGNTVTLPFGSEYSLLLKNLNPVRIKVRVSIDGTDATEGVWLVVDPNSDLELERFIRNRNMDAGNRFKFIERTESVEEHRGIKADDGLIRIEYQVEKRPPQVEKIYREFIDDYVPPRRPWRPWFDGDRPHTFGGSELFKSSSAGQRTNSKSLRARMTKGSTIGGSSIGRSLNLESDSLGDIDEASVTMASTNDKGITVAGSESSQKFRWTSSFETGPSEVIVLQLRGQVAGKKAVKAVTVEHKPKCTTCGRTNKANAKFCSNCGTALAII